MSGIEHRWDCPVRTRGMSRSMAEIVVPSVLHEGREYRRCLHCHRSAIVIRRFDREEEQ